MASNGTEATEAFEGAVMDKQLARVLADDQVEGLSERTMAEVRAVRAECRTVEAQLSYLRRLVQGQHDVVTGEIGRRSGGGAPGDVRSLVEQLPEILADRGRAGGAARPAAEPSPDALSGTLVDRFDALAAAVPLEELASASDEDLRETADALTALEADVSTLRRALFERIDVLEREMLGRYKDGGADVDELLDGPTGPPT